MPSLYDEIEDAFDADLLKATCEMNEWDFLAYPYMQWVPTDDHDPEEFYLYQDNGADILYVAHLDTVVHEDARTASYAETESGLVIHSGALDDRLGAYVGLHLLPKLGMTFDILLTTGEEMGASTAAYFNPDKEYNWMIEFDRGGTDVVMYEFEDPDLCKRVRAAGARVGNGSFSDIAYLEHLEIKGLNWGVGYTGDYHSVRGYAYLEDTFAMVEKFVHFHDANAEEYLPHEQKPKKWWDKRAGSSAKKWWDDQDEKEVKALADADINDIVDALYPESAHGDDEYGAQLEKWQANHDWRLWKA